MEASAAKRPRMESNAAGGGAGGRGGGAPVHSDGPLPERLSFRLLVPASAVAQIIGRGGENVTAIQSATRARIDVTSSPVGDLNHVTFVGAPEACETAIRAVWALVQAQEVDKVRDNQYVALSADGRSLARQTLHMLVADGHAARLIGRQGSEVRALRDRLGVNVTVQSQGAGRARTEAEKAAFADGERVVTISGPEAAVHRARAEIWHRLSRLGLARRRGGRPATGAAAATSASSGSASSAALTVGSGVPVATGGEALVSEALELPSDSVGRLIGRGGATIDAIRTSTGCAVHVSQDVVGRALASVGQSAMEAATAADRPEAEGPMIVTVVGTMPALATARLLIARALAGEPLGVSAPSAGGRGAARMGTSVPGFVFGGVSQKGSAQ
ncbi:hypothetical protein FNF31_02089 [Cafeteria roenbergensis]|uniref:K Homology domain-containing protein n=1 Tax=Cafeteria roenbergensis TaxID=33653 RepID=A0A5A8DI67_CAFRO|nr:hypothetical protein FNF31_02089 [Cafeteria roenbergensis]